MSSPVISACVNAAAANTVSVENELLLQDCGNKFTIFPILYPDIFSMYEKQVASFWMVEEVDLSSDIEHWKEKLNPSALRDIGGPFYSPTAHMYVALVRRHTIMIHISRTCC